jgi:protein O-mannosyl-transferase
MPDPAPTPKAERLNLAAFVKHILEIHENVHTERFCWIIGAGCSVTSGIPSGKTLAAEWLQKLHEDYKTDGESLAAFCQRLPQLAPPGTWDFSKLDPQNPGAHYSELYDFCFMRSVKQGFSRLERAMRGKDPSLGYTILARFLAETRHRVVVTTNFDNLISDAVAIHTSVFPFICGHESLVRFLKLEDARPLVLKIHRDLLLDPLNRKAELDRLHQSWKEILDEILAECTPVVIGYDGYDGTLMRYLKERTSLNGHLYWCHLASEDPRPEIHELVRKHRGLLVPIDGFDELMLRIGRPLNYTDPLTTMSQRFEQRKKTYTEQLDVLQKRIDAKPSPGVPTPPPDDDLKQALAQAVKQAEVAVNWWAWEKKARAQKDPAKRDKIYQEGIAACPRSHELHGYYATFLKNIRKDYDGAEALYRKALELDPNHANITGNYAIFLKNIRKDYGQAEALFRKALELDPNNALHTGNYAIFLKDIRKDYDRAEALYRKALELDPNDANNTANFAEALLEQGKWAGCEAQLRRVWQLAWAGTRELLPVTVLLRLCSLWSQTPPSAGQGATPVRDSLGWLKHLLGEGLRDPAWSFENVFAALAPRWPAERQTFARALASVVNGQAELSSLDNFPEWRDTPALIPPPEW